MQLLTTFEKKKLARDKHLISLFLELKNKYQEVTNWRIISLIAQQENLSTQTIRKILLQNKIIQKRERK